MQSYKKYLTSANNLAKIIPKTHKYQSFQYVNVQILILQLRAPPRAFAFGGKVAMVYTTPLNKRATCASVLPTTTLVGCVGNPDIRGSETDIITRDMVSNNSLSKSMCMSYLQSSNMSHDGRLTIVRPSFDCRSKLLKLVTVLALLLTIGVGNAWGGWTRVTSIAELTAGGTFIMGYESTAKSGIIVPLRSIDCNATTSGNGYFHTGKATGSSTGTIISMDTVTYSTPYEVYISSPTSGKINIQQASTGYFYGASSGGTSSNTGCLYTSGNSAETNITPEWASETNNQFKLTASVTGNYKYCAYNTGSPRFAFYKSGGIASEKIVFYKKDTKVDVMCAKGFAGNTTTSFSAVGTDYSAVANLVNTSGSTYTMQVFNGNNGQVKGSGSGAANFSCRNKTTHAGYYISKITLTVKTGTIDGSTSDRSIVYFGTSAYSNPNTSAPSGTYTSASPSSSGQTKLTWTNTNTSVTYFILYNLKTASSAYSADYATSLVVEWTKAPSCSKSVTLANNSPSNGTVTFSPTEPVATCDGSVNVTMTITPSTGYYLSAYSKSGVNTSNTPSIATSGASSESAQTPTLTFAQNTDGTYTANATFSPILVSSLTLRATQTGQSAKTGSSIAMSLYAREGQANDPLTHSLTVAYNSVAPSNALNKNYTWSVRVKASGAADWTNVGFISNTLNTNDLIEFNKNTGVLKAKDTEGTAEITITAADGGGASATATITITKVALTGVSVDPTEMEVYAGQKKSVSVTFTPANATDRSYSAGSSYTYVTIQNKAAASFNIEGKSSVTDADHEETVTVTTTDGSYTATIGVTVKPLPLAHFVDYIHNESFDDVIATVSGDGMTVTTTKSTPTHSDESDPGGSYNTCERQHLHLVGWILADWADANPSATSSEISGAGAGNFYATNADIDLVAKNGKTFYAVWSKLE